VLYLSEKVSIPLNLAEKKLFMSASLTELVNSFLKLSTRVIVLEKRMGSMLKEREGANVKELAKSFLELSTRLNFPGGMLCYLGLR